MSGVVPRNLKKKRRLNLTPFSRSPQTRHTHKHTHTHNYSIRRNALSSISPKMPTLVSKNEQDFTVFIVRPRLYVLFTRMCFCLYLPMADKQTLFAELYIKKKQVFYKYSVRQWRHSRGQGNIKSHYFTRPFRLSVSL